MSLEVWWLSDHENPSEENKLDFNFNLFTGIILIETLDKIINYEELELNVTT